MSFVGVDPIVCVLLSPFGIEGEMWDVIVLKPDHCLSFYFEILPYYRACCIRFSDAFLTSTGSFIDYGLII